MVLTKKRHSAKNIEAEPVSFSNGNMAQLLRVSSDIEIERIVKTLNLPPSRGVLVINGGTKKFDLEIGEQLANLFHELVRYVVEEKITVITGGTNAGIFSIWGEALQKYGKPAAPCIGVTIRVGLEQLEPHHTHFVLVEGDNWGDETAVMYGLVEALAKHCPSLAIYAGGGSGAISEMLQNVLQKREIVLIAGSKRSTDTVIAAYSEETSNRDKRIEQIVSEGQLTIFSINQPPIELSGLIRNRLSSKND